MRRKLPSLAVSQVNNLGLAHRCSGYNSLHSTVLPEAKGQALHAAWVIIGHCKRQSCQGEAAPVSQSGPPEKDTGGALCRHCSWGREHPPLTWRCVGYHQCLLHLVFTPLKQA